MALSNFFRLFSQDLENHVLCVFNGLFLSTFLVLQIPKVSLAASSNTLENPLTKLSISDCSTFPGLIVSKTFITLLIFVETKST